MKTGIGKATSLVVPMLLALCATAFWNPPGDFWGTVGAPKAQVESYDITRLAATKTLDTSIYDWTKLNRLVREPQNTISNLAYVAVGIAVAFAARRRISKSFAVACIFLGVGSGLYHASLLPEWRMLDILGVYTVLFCLLSVGGTAMVRRSTPELAVVVVVWVAAFYAGIHRNDIRIVGFKILDSTYVVIACVAVGSSLALWARVRISDRRRYLRCAGALTTAAVLAIVGGLTDRFGGMWANPDALVQGHSVWHTLGAVALLLAYEIFAMTGYDRSVFSRLSEPNKAPEPTPGSVTPRADARGAPAPVVAHL